MKRSILVFLVCVPGVMLTAVSGSAHGTPAAARAVANAVLKRPLLMQIGDGCGWDFPCGPRPGFGRRFYGVEGQVHIHNNYGPVHVYLGGPRHGHPPGEALDRFDCGAGSCRPNCGGYPCDEDCGPLCWMRRFGRGYCGHGCWAYREQARIEAEERAARQFVLRQYNEGAGYPPAFNGYPRSYNGEDRLPPPQVRPDPPLRFERPPPDQIAPLRRFEGPRYPPNCPGGAC